MTGLDYDLARSYGWISPRRALGLYASGTAVGLVFGIIAGSVVAQRAHVASSPVAASRDFGATNRGHPDGRR